MASSKRRLLTLLLLCALVAVGGFAPTVLPNEREVQLERVRTRLDKLQRELNVTIDRRDSAREALHAEERRIGELARSLQQIEAQLKQQSRVLAELKQREQRERTALREQLSALEAQARAAYSIGRQPHLKMLLNQENPAAAARVLAYYRYFNEARLARIAEAQSALARLTPLENAVRTKSQELGDLRTMQNREHQALEESRQRRAELVASLNRQVTSHAQEIARLRADEERLGRLLRELKTILPETNVSFPGPNERFAALKGRLPLPVAGRITARYGEPKGVGSLTWRGVFLSGKEGQTVRAVSRGRVAFADWLRGFGLLLILDHGDGYMTLYGHNESLSRRAGDWVEAGQPIATIGSTGDAPGTGVYFEIRHNGTPHDPLKWCATGRTGTARSRR